ncbi:hypothetical protein [Bradyrhizobium sp. UFLA05-112]
MLHRPLTANRKREQKRARDRRRYQREVAGLRVAPVEYSGRMVDYLLKYEWLSRNGKDDPYQIGRAIRRAIQDAVELDRK